MPDFVRTAKLAAVPRLTGARVPDAAGAGWRTRWAGVVAAETTVVPAASSAIAATGTTERVLSFNVSPVVS
jgi:hypothetical protein